MSRRRSLAVRGRARGYTAVEVLIAMTLFAIGAAGVIGMQRVAIQGGEDARRFDMATNIANEWLDRLQKDASFWRTEPDLTKPDTMGFATTLWLPYVDLCGGGTPTGATFCSPPLPSAPADGLSPAFDQFGRDLPSGTTDAFYCAQFRLTWIAAPGVKPYTRPLRPSAIMRAEVRVYWNSLEQSPIGNCGSPPPEVIPAGSPIHTVYAATAIRQGAPP